MAATRPSRHRPRGQSRPNPRSRRSGIPAPTPARPVAVAPVESDNPFLALGVPEQLCGALAASGITEPFPIQSATLPDSLTGRDVLGRGRTGSGKTLAFGLAVITRLSTLDIRCRPSRPRALILAPTRELALQIDATVAPLARLMGLRTTTIFGGVGQNPQVDALRRGVDIAIACPGRLEDLIGQGHCRLDDVEISVLDEADHMADLGFLPGVKRLLDRVPSDAQHLLFSATLDKGVDVLVKRYLHDPVTHSVDSEQSPVQTMTHHVLHVRSDDRVPVVVDLAAAPGRTIIFTRTKHRAKQLTKQLNANGVRAVEMHGNLSQAARTRNLSEFSSGRAAALVATDIAARGIHVDDVSLVVHADPPIEHKAYLHRSGRTARAGAEGVVVTIAVETQRREVEKLMKKAGISPTVTVARPDAPILSEIAPGQRLKAG
ncbi:MAG: DEAD/DEAH box helicase [Acidimicrobiia bacterium]|nr:DEAD/DEAH box helicase [Acidimicrobiia bacterium]